MSHSDGAGMGIGVIMDGLRTSECWRREIRNGGSVTTYGRTEDDMKQPKIFGSLQPLKFH
jgi:hypothetical protein